MVKRLIDFLSSLIKKPEEKQKIRLDNFPFECYGASDATLMWRLKVFTDTSIMIFDEDTKNFFVDNDIHISRLGYDPKLYPIIICDNKDLKDESFIRTLPKELRKNVRFLSKIYGDNKFKFFNEIDVLEYHGTPEALSMLRLAYG